MTLAVTRGGNGLHVSLSHPRHPTFPVGVALGPDDVVERNGVTHLSLRPELRVRADDAYFGRPGVVAAANGHGDDLVTRPG